MECLEDRLREIAASVRTAREELARFVGLSSGGVELLRKFGAVARHSARAEAAQASARAWVDYFLPTRTEEDREFFTLLLRFEEGKGLFGGPLFALGAATTRHPAFRMLGNGRRLASDGDTWTSAIWNAERLGVPFQSVAFGPASVTYSLQERRSESEGWVTPIVTLTFEEFVLLFTQEGAKGVLRGFIGEKYADEAAVEAVVGAANLHAAMVEEELRQLGS